MEKQCYCRIRAYVPLKGKGLRKVNGTNLNPFYTIPKIKAPLVHSTSIPDFALQKVYEYDLWMKKGEVIEIVKL